VFGFHTDSDGWRATGLSCSDVLDVSRDCFQQVRRPPRLRRPRFSRASAKKEVELSVHLRSKEVEPSVHLRSKEVEPSVHLRSKEVEPSVHLRSKEVEPSVHLRSKALEPYSLRVARSRTNYSSSRARYPTDLADLPSHDAHPVPPAPPLLPPAGRHQEAAPAQAGRPRSRALRVLVLPARIRARRRPLLQDVRGCRPRGLAEEARGELQRVRAGLHRHDPEPGGSGGRGGSGGHRAPEGRERGACEPPPARPRPPPPSHLRCGSRKLSPTSTTTR
jgi:hypothetical protein